MSLTKFDNTSLVRDRDTLELFEADVYIAKGNLDSETLPDDSTITTFLSEMEKIGVNAKESPVFNDEDIIEENDYENEPIGAKAAGDIVVKKINSDFLDWISDELRNTEVTVLIIPKNCSVGDLMLFINSVKLTKKIEGKANAEETSKITFSYSRRVKKITQVYKIHKLESSGT